MNRKIAKADEDVQKLISKKRYKDDDDRTVGSEIFDSQTLKTLYKLANQGYIDILNGAISTGKEANVLKGIKEDNSFVAVKIYRIATSDFKKMNFYLDGDSRFKVKAKNRRQIIYSWTKKEFKNLKRLYNAEVCVPKVHTSLNNVLVMDFIGDKDGNEAKTVKNYPPKNPEKFFKFLLEELYKFVNDAKLVHGDLSNYNILNNNEKPAIIDVSQSVVCDHPIAKELLERDINNIVNDYTKLGVKTSIEEVKEYIKLE